MDICVTITHFLHKSAQENHCS